MAAKASTKGRIGRLPLRLKLKKTTSVIVILLIARLAQLFSLKQDYEGFLQKEELGAVQASSSAGNTNRILCLNGEMGQNCNKIIQLANAMLMTQNYTIRDSINWKVGLGSGLWTTWYNSFFDPMENVTLDVSDSACDHKIGAFEAHYITSFHNYNEFIDRLHPKEEFRRSANKILEQKRHNNSQKIITVHRRNLEGECHQRIQKDNTFCFLPDYQHQDVGVCDIVYGDVQQLMAKRINKSNNMGVSHMVLLMTDSQVLELDSTFPVMDRHPFPVQLWMMASSDLHFGNPASSVDYIVAHWRRNVGNGVTEPSSCYP